MRLNKLKHVSLEQRNIYCEDEARRTDDLCSKDLSFPVIFREEFLKAKFAVRAAGYTTSFQMAGNKVTGKKKGNRMMSLESQVSGFN